MLVDRGITRGCQRKLAVVHVRTDEWAPKQRDLARVGKLRDGLDYSGSNDRHHGTFRKEAQQFPIRDLPCPNQEAAATAQVEHDRVHGLTASFYHSS
jgi:hypothetical protein